MNQHETSFFFFYFLSGGFSRVNIGYLWQTAMRGKKEKVVPVMSSRTCHAECVNADKTIQQLKQNSVLIHLSF